MQSPTSSRHHPTTRALAAWLLGALVCCPPYAPAAWAELEGENVVRGQASFQRDGDLTVIRPSDGAIINYTRFDILRQETVRFEQPNERSRVLNRVHGDASRIDGTLQSNGVVYLVNPAGIFIGKEAVIDAGRFVAAAGDMTNRDFIKGIERFQLSGAVENLGSIEARSVSLLGRTVANHGSIVAPGGVIALVAGERVVLTRIEGGISVEVDGGTNPPDTGIVQTGTVDARGGVALFAVGDHYSLALNHTGLTRAREIQARGGDDGTMRIAGTLDASNPEPGKQGGRIRITGHRIELDGATLDASGAAGGGRIRLGGNIRGAGPLEARRVFVDDQSVLRADALEQGDGGSIVVFAEEAAGFLGQISARGGAQGGDGGFAELSSNGRLIDRGDVDLSAPAGQTGTLLYDPQDIRILGGSLDGDDGGNDVGQLANSVLFDDPDPTAAPFDIYESEIEGTNANIVLEARNSIRAEGSFDHEQSSEGVGVLLIQSGNDFTLRTANDRDDASGSTSPVIGIDLTGSAQGTDLEVRTGGDGTITMETGTQWQAATTEPAQPASPKADLEVGKLTTTGSQVTLRTADGSIATNTVDTSGADGATGGNGGFIQIDAGDNDGDETTTVVTGDLISRGGNGSAGRGGNGGSVDVQTRGKPLPDPVPDPRPVATGGGPITIGDIDVHGGDGSGGAGGLGGVVAIEARVRGDVFIGDIDTRGGSGSDGSGPIAITNGGAGGTVDLAADNGDIRVGAIDTSGGNTDGTELPDPPEDPEDTVPVEVGGNSGQIRMSAGRGIDLTGTIPDPHGDILLAGRLTSLGGGQGAPANTNGEGFSTPISLTAVDTLEHDGDAGPHIVTTGFVTLDASEIGADGTLEIDAGDQMDPNGRVINILEVRTDERADVSVPIAGFEVIQVTTRDTDSDIDIVQGGDEIRVDGDTINRIDTRDEHTQVAVILRDNLSGNADVPMDLHVPTGSIDAGSVLELHGEDDVVLDGAGVAIQAHEDPFTEDEEAETPPTNADIVIFAGEDAVQSFQSGRIRGDGTIDRQGTNTREAGRLLLRAAEGIGTQTNPLLMSGGGAVAASNGNSLPGDNDGGIFLRNLSDGAADTLTVTQVGAVVGARVTSGNGGIEIDNQGGELRVENQVRSGGGGGAEGTGNVRLAADGGPITLGVASGAAVDALGEIELDGDVLLRNNTRLASRNDDAVRLLGDIDTDPTVGQDQDPPLTFVLSLTVDTTDATTLAGDVGQLQDLNNFGVGGDLRLTGDRSVDVINEFDVDGHIRSASGTDGASLAIRSGRNVRIGGDVGVDHDNAGGADDERLSSFSVAQNTTPPPTLAIETDVPTILFDGATAQTVETGAGGIALNAAGRTDVPDIATVGKSGGDLTLQSAGQIDLGQNEKLTVQGVATLTSTSSGVRIGDVSALELHVNSLNTEVRARAPGLVRQKNGAGIRDFGPDLIANVVTFTGSDPLVVGTGAAPRIAAGSVSGAGTLETTGLDRIGADRLEHRGTLLDLGILPPDPGHETPLRGPVISGIVPPRTTREPVDSLAPSAEETLAWLRCDPDPQSGSIDCPKAAPGSSLDSPRGLELSQSAQGWLGNSDEARSRRAAVARLEPQALRELADFLTEVRLLGLPDEEYQAVRDALYAELLADAGTGAPEPAVLAQGVQAQAPDIPL